MVDNNEIVSVLAEYGYKSEIKTVTKDGRRREAAIVFFEDSNISPTIYLDTLDYADAEDAANQIIDLAIEYKRDSIDVDFICDWDKVKTRLFPCVAYIENVTENVITSLFAEDVYSYLRIKVTELNNINASIVVTEELFKRWEVSKAEAFKVAYNNVRDDVQIDNIGNVLNQIADINIEDNFGMFVISNSKRMYGGAYLFDTQVLSNVAEIMGCESIYLLPSSIHEIIALPYSDALKISKLKDMVETINSTELSDNEILSDHVYYYNSVANVIIEK